MVVATRVRIRGDELRIAERADERDRAAGDPEQESDRCASGDRRDERRGLEDPRAHDDPDDDQDRVAAGERRDRPGGLARDARSIRDALMSIRCGHCRRRSNCRTRAPPSDVTAEHLPVRDSSQTVPLAVSSPRDPQASVPRRLLPRGRARQFCRLEPPAGRALEHAFRSRGATLRLGRRAVAHSRSPGARIARRIELLRGASPVPPHPIAESARADGLRDVASVSTIDMVCLARDIG